MQQNDIGDGIVQDTSGDVIFKVKFRAICCIPEEGEVLDGEVFEVNNVGIQNNGKTIFTFDGRSCIYDGHGGQVSIEPP